MAKNDKEHGSAKTGPKINGDEEAFEKVPEKTWSKITDNLFRIHSTVRILRGVMDDYATNYDSAPYRPLSGGAP